MYVSKRQVPVSHSTLMSGKTKKTLNRLPPAFPSQPTQALSPRETILMIGTVPT